jgi:hypothetical protein
MCGVSMAQNYLNAQSNRLDPSCEAAHAAAVDCFSGGSVVGDAGGGDMDDVMRRLGAVETDISGMKADISDMKTSIIQWMVATTIAAAGVAFAIAKFVH